MLAIRVQRMLAIRGGAISGSTLYCHSGVTAAPMCVDDERVPERGAADVVREAEFFLDLGAWEYGRVARDAVGDAVGRLAGEAFVVERERELGDLPCWLLGDLAALVGDLGLMESFLGLAGEM
jgi:hypothetical protein